MQAGKVMVLVLGAAVCVGHAQQKKRVAVLDFDYATVKSGLGAIFGNANADIGKGISDLLVDRLVAGGTYSVIERKALDKIIAEQNLSNSDRADSNTAAKIGRLLGVDAIITGSITQFGRDDKKTNIGGLGGIGGRFGLGGVQRSKATAVVGITARMVNVDTGEILTSMTGKGEATRNGTGLLGSGGSPINMAGGVIDMRAHNFSDTVLGEATNRAVDSIGEQLTAKAASLPSKTVAISALVADASPDGTVVVNLGSRGGLKVGDRLQVTRKVRDVRDPATGRVIRSIENKVGELVITDVDERSAVGKFTGTGPAKVGDSVKN